MTTVQLLIVCASAIVVALILVAGASLIVAAHTEAEATRDAGLAVTVHTRKPDDQTIHGVVVADYADHLVLDAARYVTAAGDNPIPGTVSVPKSSISWLQRHDTPAAA